MTRVVSTAGGTTIVQGDIFSNRLLESTEQISWKEPLSVTVLFTLRPMLTRIVILENIAF